VDDAAEAAAVVAAVSATTDGIARDRTTTRTPPDDVDDLFRKPARPIASTASVLASRAAAVKADDDDF